MTAETEQALSDDLVSAVRRLIEYRRSMRRADADHLQSMDISSDAKSGLFKASELIAFETTKPSATGEQSIIAEIRSIGERLFAIRGFDAMQDACERMWGEPDLGGVGVDIVDKNFDGVCGWMA